MKKMQMWEVGFKEELWRSGYADKYNVAADTSEDAISMARQYMMSEYRVVEDIGKEELQEIATRDVAKILHIGEVVVP